MVRAGATSIRHLHLKTRYKIRHVLTYAGTSAATRCHNTLHTKRTAGERAHITYIERQASVCALPPQMPHGLVPASAAPSCAHEAKRTMLQSRVPHGQEDPLIALLFRVCAHLVCTISGAAVPA